MSEAACSGIAAFLLTSSTGTTFRTTWAYPGCATRVPGRQETVRSGSAGSSSAMQVWGEWPLELSYDGNGSWESFSWDGRPSGPISHFATHGS
jgi:hypothetical protein